MTSYDNLDQLEKLRPLGALEAYSSARHHLNFYFNVGISASYSCTTSGTKSLKQTIFASLALVIQKHPILSAIVLGEDSANPYFVRLPTINLEQAVTLLDREEPHVRGERDDELDRILETQHNMDFKTDIGKLPFWRVIILTQPNVENEFTASFIFHHALGDGMSGVIFHRDFLSALQADPLALVSDIISPPQSDLLPTIEVLHPLPLPAPNTKKHEVQNLWSGESVNSPKRHHYRSVFLSHPTTRRFVQACKAHNVTVASTMTVILATALVKHIPEHYEELEFGIPVDVRRWMPAPITTDSFGVWIDNMSQYYRREKVEGFSWEEARRSKEAIDVYIKSKGKVVNIASLRNVEDMREYFMSSIAKGKRSSFGLSNLGAVNVTDLGQGGWIMGRMVFSRCAFVVGSAISVGLLSGGDGCLTMGFSWHEEVVNSNMIEKLIEGVQKEIQVIIDN